MSIKISPISALNLFQIKKAIEHLGRNAMDLQKTADADYTATVPTTDTLAEGQAIYYSADSGTTIKIYFNVGNVIRSITMTG